MGSIPFSVPRERVAITAGDDLRRLGTAYDFMGLCAKACWVELAQTAAEIGAMPNGSEVLSIDAENDIET